MKKLILLLLPVLMAFIGNAQIKHNKFTTRYTFDQFNQGAEFWQTDISEIKNNSGYFLSNRYDDQANGFHPSLVKIDVDGNVIFDTIYELIPNNLGSYTDFRKAITGVANHTTLFSTGALGTQMTPTSPYIINYDINGNMLWHKGFTDDTLDLEAKVLIHTQDGGYVIGGVLYDWYNGFYPASGYAVKLDNTGNLLWQKYYMNKDTMEVKFQDGIETPDGGLFYVGDAPNFQGGAKPLQNMDVVLCMVKTDNNGDIIWSKGMTYAPPIDNYYGPGNISVGMLNDTNAFVAAQVRDTTGNNFDRIAITSVNVNTGVNNWTKYYSLSMGEEVNLKKVMADNKGNIVIGASYYGIPATGVHFVLDIDGNVINTKSYKHFNEAVFPYHSIPTLDGGYAHIGSIDANEVLVVKTDKDMDPSCHWIDSTFQFSLTPTLINDTSYFGMVDSVSSIPNLMEVQLSGGTIINTSTADSTICNCNNMVYGNVVEGGVTPVNNAKVFLFRKGMVPFPWRPIDSTITDVAGAYQFDYVPTDSFIVRVVPDTLLFPGAMISYFKDQTWCYRWDSAGVFSVHCDSGAVQKDVDLVVPAPLTGNSGLNGYVFESYGSFSKGSMIPGDPIPGIDITVDQSPGGVAGSANTDGSGYYSLTGLSTSTTYVISIDLPGLPHDSVWTINVNLSDTTLDSLNFYIDSTGIYILAQDIGVGVDVMQTDNIDVDLYPNPSNGIFTVNIDAIKPENIELQLTDKVGRVISTVSYNVIKGDNSIRFDDAKHLPSGIYLLKIREGNNLYVKKIVKL